MIKMNNGKNKVIVYLCAIVFGVLGVYLTFFAGNTDKYDSQTSAYKIEPNERYDSEDGTIYRPIYYFKVDGRDYECKTNSGSSSYPNEKKNTVYIGLMVYYFEVFYLDKEARGELEYTKYKYED